MLILLSFNFDFTTRTAVIIDIGSEATTLSAIFADGKCVENSTLSSSNTIFQDIQGIHNVACSFIPATDRVTDTLSLRESEIVLTFMEHTDWQAFLQKKIFVIFFNFLMVRANSCFF